MGKLENCTLLVVRDTDGYMFPVLVPHYNLEEDENTYWTSCGIDGIAYDVRVSYTYADSNLDIEGVLLYPYDEDDPVDIAPLEILKREDFTLDEKN